MSDFERHDYGPLQTYEVVWASGHIETVQGHQVSHTGGMYDLGQAGAGRPVRFKIHGEFDGHWRLMLSGLEDDVVTIRNVTVPEQAGGAS